MGGGAGPIDEECRRRFERRWQEADDVQVSDFLPDPSAPAYRETLLELLLIDLEMRAKRGRPPSVEEYARRYGLDAAARERLERERDDLARRFGVPDRRVGRYILRDLVGQGASAHVWRAWDPDLSREVALKRLRPGLAATPEAVARFQREARSAARLRHPAIVTVHEVGKDGDDTYLVSDLIPGPTLAVAMRERSFSPHESARLVADLADAIEYAHQCGVVHRDVKPGNILLDAGGRPLLADFGLARLAEADATLTRHGDLLGTPAYMSPEQARGDTEAVGPPTDIYSLGVVLYELLCGRVPFEGGSVAALSYAVIHSDPVRPRRVQPSVPADLESVCLKAMAREPDRRYATAAALAQDLRRYLAGESVHARPRRALTQTALWVRRNPGFSASIAAVLVVAAVGFLRVLEERTRFREQREQAQASLYRACLRETEALLAAPGGHGREAAWASLEEAARLDVASRDPLELRSLALRCLTAEGPYFRRVAAWDDDPFKGPLALAPDGRMLAEAGAGGTRLRAAATGATLAFDPAPSSAVVFAPDRPWLVTVHEDSILVRDAASMAPVMRLEAARGIRTVAIARGGRWLAGGGTEVSVWDLAAPALPPLTLAHAARALAFSPDGTHLAIGGEDGLLRIHDLGGGDTVTAWTFADPVPLVAFGEKGNLVAASRELYTLCRVDPDAKEAQQAIDRHDAPIHIVFPGPRGLILTASEDGTLGAWDRTAARVASTRASAGGTRSAAGAGAFVVTLGAAGRRVLWEVAWTPGRLPWQSEHAVVFVPGSRRIFSGQQVLAIDGGLLAPVPFAPPGGVIWGVAADPVHARLASVDHAGGIVLRNGRTLALERTLPGGGEISWTAGFSPDGSVLAAGSGPDVVLLGAEDGRERGRLRGHEGNKLVVALAFHPRLPLLVTAALDRTIRLWDWSKATEERRLLDGVTVHDLAFAEDRLVAACGDGAIRVWDAGFGAPQRIAVGEDPVWAVAFSRGGLLAAGSQAGDVRLLDPKSWRILAVLGGVPRVRRLAFDDTGRYLAASAWGAGGAVWDLQWLREQIGRIGLDWP